MHILHKLSTNYNPATSVVAQFIKTYSSNTCIPLTEIFSQGQTEQ